MATDAVARKINEIRLKHGWSGEVCPTCGRDVRSPYRRYDARGKVTEGCVDACHTGKLVTPSESARWHSSKGAKQIRKNELQTLTGRR